MSYISSLKNISSFSPESQWQWYNGEYKNDPKDEEKEKERKQQTTGRRYLGHAYDITCRWEPFRKLLLMQWTRLMPAEVDRIGPNRGMLARLIESKYGISVQLMENYLLNLERALPVN